MAPSPPEAVDIHVLRSLLRLVSDLRDLPDGSPEQRVLAMERLGAILGAKVVLWMEVVGIDAGLPVLACPVERGWSDAGERAVFHHYLAHQRELVDPAVPRLLTALSPAGATLLRDDVIPDSDWYASEHVQDIRRAARVDSFLLAARAPLGGRPSSLVLHRPWRDRPFTAKDRAVLDAFRRETPWLDSTPRASLSGLDLSPRLAAVLDGLARGLSEKEIAAELRISPHTAHDHVKALHRRLGVRSRGELLARALTPRRGTRRAAD